MAMSEPPTVMKVRPRAYQLEMLEASLKKNIIVAVSDATGSRAIHSNNYQMGTGSGKTQMQVQLGCLEHAN